VTIVVGVATPEGLVLGTDSRTTYEMGDHHRIASDNAQKLFVVGDMGVATFGSAFVGFETIAGLMDQFAAQVGDDGKDVHHFAEALAKFFSGRFLAQLKTEGREWDPDTEPFPFGFLVAGYDDDGIGHIKGVNIPDPTIDPELIADTTTGGTMWRGQTDVIGRLIKGVDAERLQVAGAKVDEDLSKAFAQVEYQLLSPITVQDGIEWVGFLVRTTIDMQRFSDGTMIDPRAIPGCGGRLQLLAIERSGPSWVSRPILTAPGQPGKAEGAQL
jgi:hypothetical protein